MAERVPMVDGIITEEYLTSRADVLRATVAEGASDAQILHLVHVAVAYQLDPFVGEVYWSEKLGKPITSRDGYRKIARRDPGFNGAAALAVYSGDSFAVELTSGAPHVQHSPLYKGVRGTCIGAWALAWHEAIELPVYAFAPFAQYVRDSATWRRYPDAMISKVAESMVLRSVIGISGLPTSEEIGDELPEPGRSPVIDPHPEPLFNEDPPTGAAAETAEVDSTAPPAEPPPAREPAEPEETPPEATKAADERDALEHEIFEIESILIDAKHANWHLPKRLRGAREKYGGSTKLGDFTAVGMRAYRDRLLAARKELREGGKRTRAETPPAPEPVKPEPDPEPEPDPPAPEPEAPRRSTYIDHAEASTTLEAVVAGDTEWVDRAAAALERRVAGNPIFALRKIAGERPERPFAMSALRTLAKHHRAAFVVAALNAYITPETRAEIGIAEHMEAIQPAMDEAAAAHAAAEGAPGGGD